MGRPRCDPALGVELENERGGHRSHGRGLRVGTRHHGLRRRRNSPRSTRRRARRGVVRFSTSSKTPVAPPPGRPGSPRALRSRSVPQARVNGVDLYYEERGSGTPIPGIHGAGSSAALLGGRGGQARAARAGDHLRPPREQPQRTVPDPYETTTVREHADDALALLRVLDAEPAVLVGRSYGGTVALDLALRRPESAAATALLEAGPMGLSAEYDAWFVALPATLESSACPQRIRRNRSARGLRSLGGAAPGVARRRLHGERPRAAGRDARRGASE